MKILLAEDEPVSRRMLEGTLARWGYEVVPARDGTQAWDLLQEEEAPRLAILDWMMPGMNGPDLCRKLRQRSAASYVYVILLTGQSESADVVQGLDSGADDYMVKPFQPDELRARLRAGERILALQAELLATREELRIQAIHDPLTGLLNRRAILPVLDRDLARARRESSKVSVVMADIDRFKNINDALGHLAGDSVLTYTAHRLKAQLRNADAIGRFGGEEFLIVLPGCDAAFASTVAERLRAGVAERPVHWEGHGELFVTCSFGVAEFSPVVHTSTSLLISDADGALYEAKRAGRDRVHRSETSGIDAGALPGGDVGSQP